MLLVGALIGLLASMSGCAIATRPLADAKPKASATAGATASPKRSTAPNPFLARVPKFPPAPAPERIALPDRAEAPIYHRLPVAQPVAFLTIDDGLVRQPQAIQLMQAAHIPFTMFLIAPVAAANPQFFKAMEQAGGVVEDHTVNHANLRGRSYEAQRKEICDAVSTLSDAFGSPPKLFRPPYGDYDQTTLRAVHDCGLKAAFHWSETVNYGKVNYQTSLHRIRPGDIILMHFRAAFVNDVLAALTAIHDAGLTPALLEDYFG
jgi:peptidoglycan/xylan/chitin deacetylase (PgdA/CDA1 family)